MADTSDIPYHVLEVTYQQDLRQASLQAAKNQISNAIADLPIFPYYTFNLDVLSGRLRHSVSSLRGVGATLNSTSVWIKI